MTMRATLVGSATLAWLSACGADDIEHFRGGDWAPPSSIQRVPAPLGGAHCDIDVEGVGVIGMEDDYLPHVIQCENGGANLEALKAQAIAARSVAYYAIETSGGICDSQGCQVYSCGSNPADIHYQAVNETSGQYLSYNDTLTYAFYVAGDSGVQSPGCVGVDGNAATEHWITYNSGRTGTDVEQTDLGFIHDPGDNGYGQNRGCMGQWSARCLENDNGVGVTGILQFFYGDDIGIIQAPGACVLPLPGDTSGPPPDPTTGGGDETSAESSEGGVVTDSTTMPPQTSTTPDEASSADASDSNASLTTSADSSGEGTADGGGFGALPDTFGENSGGDDGCGCSSSRAPMRDAFALAMLGIVLGVRRRRA